MNTTTRLGKIARLPHSIREQLNLKLHDNIPAKSILPWLNSLPETKSILAADFDNCPITKQNLSEWKHGGHRDWLLQFNAANFLQFMDIPSSSSSIPHNHVRDGIEQTQNPPTQSTEHATRNTAPFTHHASRITDTEHASRITSKLLLWAQLQYISMARHIDSESDPDRKFSALRHFANDISRLKRSSLADEFLQIQREWLALSQSNSTEKKALEFCKWVKRPDIADALKNKQRGFTREFFRKFEEDNYLMGPDDHQLEEHIAKVRLARELMAYSKAKEAEANRKPGEVGRGVPTAPPDIDMRAITLEELLPFIPDKPLTESDHPEAEPPTTDSPDPSHSSHASHKSHQSQNNPSYSSHPSGPSYQSDSSDSVQPGPTQSSQIQPSLPPQPDSMVPPLNDSPPPSTL